jgi:hypothetical protein
VDPEREVIGITAYRGPQLSWYMWTQRRGAFTLHAIIKWVSKGQYGNPVVNTYCAVEGGIVREAEMRVVDLVRSLGIRRNGLDFGRKLHLIII